MDKDTEITENTEKKQKDHLFKKGQSGNPNGRPTGAENFSTKWRRAVEKIGSQNGMTADEIEQQLLLVGYKKAKDGDFKFYQDVFDRVYGKAPQTVDFKGEVTINEGLTQEEKESLLNLLK